MSSNWLTTYKFRAVTFTVALQERSSLGAINPSPSISFDIDKDYIRCDVHPPNVRPSWTMTLVWLLCVFWTNGGNRSLPWGPSNAPVEMTNFLRVSFTKEKMPWCHCPFKFEAYRPEVYLFFWSRFFTEPTLHPTRGLFHMILSRAQFHKAVISRKYSVNFFAKQKMRGAPVALM